MRPGFRIARRCRRKQNQNAPYKCRTDCLFEAGRLGKSACGQAAVGYISAGDLRETWLVALEILGIAYQSAGCGVWIFDRSLKVGEVRWLVQGQGLIPWGRWSGVSGWLEKGLGGRPGNLGDWKIVWTVVREIWGAGKSFGRSSGKSGWLENRLDGRPGNLGDWKIVWTVVREIRGDWKIVWMAGSETGGFGCESSRFGNLGPE